MLERAPRTIQQRLPACPPFCQCQRGRGAIAHQAPMPSFWKSSRKSQHSFFSANEQSQQAQQQQQQVQHPGTPPPSIINRPLPPSPSRAAAQPSARPAFERACVPVCLLPRGGGCSQPSTQHSTASTSTHASRQPRQPMLTLTLLSQTFRSPLLAPALAAPPRPRPSSARAA